MGDFERTHKYLQNSIIKYPNNILIIYTIHMLEFYMGWTSQLCKTAINIAKNFDVNLEEYGYIKGIESFSLEECGHLSDALVSAKIALKYNKDDIYAIHSMCHIFLEQGKYKEGIAFLEEKLPLWSTNFGMRIHVWWHKAIFHLYLMDIEEVIYIYDTKIRDKNSEDGKEDLDAVSLLWRLNLLGYDTDERFKALSTFWSSDIGNGTYYFNSMHALLVKIGANSRIDVEKIFTLVTKKKNSSQLDKVIKNILSGFYYLFKGQYLESFNELKSVLPSSNLIGGSNAQRDIIEFTILLLAFKNKDIIHATEELLKSGRVFKYDSPLKVFYKTKLEKYKLEIALSGTINSLNDIFEILNNSKAVLDEHYSPNIDYVNIKTEKRQLDFKSRKVAYLENQEKLLYVLKGKIILLRFDNTLFHLDTSNLLKKMEVINVGEPVLLSSNIQYIILPHKNTQGLYISFNSIHEYEKIYIGDDLKKNINDALILFDDYYTGYDERYKTVYKFGADLWETSDPNESLKLVLAKHRYLLGKHIVDLGCGEGRDTIYLGLRGAKATGIDISSTALNKARERANRYNLLHVNFIESDVIYLRNIKNNTYSFAINMGCLHMITDNEHRKMHITRVRDILQKGGYFLIDHCQKNWGKNFFSIPNYEEVLPEFKIGNKIPRKIRIQNNKTISIPLEVIPYKEKDSDALIEEITQIGFKVIDVLFTDTEAFGNSATILFQKT